MVGKRREIEKIKIYIPFCSVPTLCVIENFKKIAKKLKKLKKTILASFQAKIGWNRLRKMENKKLSFCFVSTRCVIENSKQIPEKFKKLKNEIMASFQGKIDWKRP